MASPAEVVTTFLSECGKGKEEMQKAFRTYFTQDTVWENVGMSTTTGVEEAFALMDNFESTAGASHFDADMVAIAIQGNRVLTERVDRMLKPDGTPAMTIRLMGTFEIEGDRITAWRDYFDTAPFSS